jgi:biotin carboxyl carrier protein
MESKGIMDSGTLASSNGDYRVSQEEYIKVEQLKRLVQMMDKSDVSEIEVKQSAAGTRLVLRKAKLAESGTKDIVEVVEESEEAPEVEKKFTVTAPLVGIFHPWAKPKGKALVSVGDKVKAGQLIGTIQSLNVLNEVETSVAGRVLEVLVQDGQPVEYGQPLVTLDIAEEA